MLNKINFAIIIFSCFCFLSEFSSAQSNEQLVQEGISNYQHGNYEKAIDLFNRALRNIASTQKVIQLANVSVKSDVTVSKESDVRVSNERYARVSNVQLAGLSRRESMGVSPENQVSNPLYFHSAISGKIYVYRGRAYLELGMTRKAFNDFDDAMNLNPLFTEVYFRRAITYRNREEDDICGDLKSAMEMGYRSAETLYNRLCNRTNLTVAISY
jgi:tetratricopeptide (TPR) repeat protein